MKNLIRKICLILLIFALFNLNIFSKSKKDKNADSIESIDTIENINANESEYSNKWFIAQTKGKNNINQNKMYGPYDSATTAIATWILSGLKDDSNYCLSKGYNFVTNKPSTYYRKIYIHINNEIISNEDAAIEKYKVDSNNLIGKKNKGKNKKEKKQKKEESLETVETIKTEITSEPTKTSSISDLNPKVEDNTIQQSNEKNEEIDNKAKEEEKGRKEEVLSTEKLEEDKKSQEKVVSGNDITIVVTEVENETKKSESLSLENEEKTAKVSDELNQKEVIQIKEAEPVKETENKKTSQPEVKKNTEIPFTLDLESKNQVSRYKKEYLQDYIPEENDLPDSEVSVSNSKIKNPDEKDSYGRTLLMNAAKAGNDWQIKNLLSSNADINLQDKDGWTALMYAVRYQESLSVVKTLLEAKADVRIYNNYDSSALVLAASYNNNPEIIDLLLNYYSTSEKEVIKAFVVLISTKQTSEYTEIAKLNVFLKKSIPLNTFYNGKTPLMYAAKFSNSTNIIKLLLENDALTGLRSTEGKTAFDYASENKNLIHDEIYWKLNKK